jgi:hypothetical protein
MRDVDNDRTGDRIVSVLRTVLWPIFEIGRLGVRALREHFIPLGPRIKLAQRRQGGGSIRGRAACSTYLPADRIPPMTSHRSVLLRPLQYSPIFTPYPSIINLNVHLQRIQIAWQDRPDHWRKCRYRRGTRPLIIIAA